MQFKALKASHLKSVDQADATLEGLAETHRTLRENIMEAQQRQTKYIGGNEITFDVGDKVWISTKHFRTTRPSEKLDYKHAGPYTGSKVIIKNADKLDLPKTMQNHNVVHVSQIDLSTPPVSVQPSREPHPMMVDYSEEWELIPSSTPNGVIGSFIVLFNKPDTDMSIGVGSQRKTSGMLRSWWTNSIAATQGHPNSGAKESNWHSFSFLL